MGPEDRQRADRLDRYWDAVVQHEPGTLTPEVDTVTATIIAQLNTPPVSPRFLSVRQQYDRPLLRRPGRLLPICPRLVDRSRPKSGITCPMLRACDPGSPGFAMSPPQ